METLFKFKNKTTWFIATLIATVIFIRILAYFSDSDRFIFGYELHHFYYGLVLLIILNLLTLFSKIHPKTYTILSAIAIGLISDELLFIMGKMPNTQYLSTLNLAIFTTLIPIVILGIILLKPLERLKKLKSIK
jgi:hypothetical protein